MTTAFVLSGGGSLGAIQVGMLQALAARGIAPDLLVGASVGALNAAFVAGRGWSSSTLDALAAEWRALRRSDVFPMSPARHVLALAGARPSLCSPSALERLIRAHLDFRQVEDTRIPLHVVATDVLSGHEVLISAGHPVAAVMASTAIPGVFPAVELDGRPLFDGGVANNTPVSHAVALGADRIVVLPTGYACDLSASPRSALGAAMHALTLLVHRRLVHDVETYADQVELVVLPPLCPLSVSPVDFRQSDRLRTRAEEDVGRWLDGGTRRGEPTRTLSLHRHRHAPGAPSARTPNSGGHAA